MGILVFKRVSELGDFCVLAPERYDPRRMVEIASKRSLRDIVDIVTENRKTRSSPSDRPVLVLDTTHAYEGFVIHRHDPVAPTEVRSTKRLILPGDLIISRLRPYLRQVAFVDEDLFYLVLGGNDVAASTEFFVIRGKKGFDAAALVPFLLSGPVQSALAAGQEGGHHPRFSKELLGSLRIPDGLMAEADTTARRFRELASCVRRSLSACRELVASMQRHMGDGPRGDMGDGPRGDMGDGPPVQMPPSP